MKEMSMNKKICLLSCHNQYTSKRYFTQKFAEALIKCGLETQVLSWSHGPCPEEVVAKIQTIQPRLTASFHQLPLQADGTYFWDRLRLPHWSILVDPVFYDLELMQSPYSWISCVDQEDCALLNAYHFPQNFFFPHAVEKELVQPMSDHRPIDVIFLGTCYDPDQLYAHWQSHYSKDIIEVLEEAVGFVLAESKTSFVRALRQALVFQGIDPKEVEFDQLAHEVDQYTRGIDRLNLIRSIKSSKVHVFGESCWREGVQTKGWSHYLTNQENIILHPPVNFSEALNLLRQSKICLNSMPFFKNGTHERVFTAAACGAVPFNSQNAYLKEHIFENFNQVFYNSLDLGTIDKQIKELINDKILRKSIITQTQQKIIASYTWDTRANFTKNLFFN